MTLQDPNGNRFRVAIQQVGLSTTAPTGSGLDTSQSADTGRDYIIAILDITNLQPNRAAPVDGLKLPSDTGLQMTVPKAIWTTATATQLGSTCTTMSGFPPNSCGVRTSLYTQEGYDVDASTQLAGGAHERFILASVITIDANTDTLNDLQLFQVRTAYDCQINGNTTCQPATVSIPEPPPLTTPLNWSTT